MINAAIVGAALSSGLTFGVPNVEKHYPGQGNAFMQTLMEQLAGMGVPGAQGLVPKTQVVGGFEASQPTLQNVGVQNSGRESYRG